MLKGGRLEKQQGQRGWTEQAESTFLKTGGMAMKLIRHLPLGFILLCGLILMQAGCAHNVPIKKDATADIRRLFPPQKKINARVGFYLSEDIRSYVYSQQKMGMTFRMEVGKYLVPISKEMIAALFEEVVEVTSLPPYVGDYRPSVEAVVEPQIIYAYGNAVGTVSGYVESTVLFRINGYDLSGEFIWKGEALGQSRSKEMNFAVVFLSEMEKVGEVGYQAGLDAAKKIVDDFERNKPPEFYSLLELKTLPSKKSKQGERSDLFQAYYDKGLDLFKKQEFEQAAYSFSRANELNPEDLLTQFHMAICDIYTAQKSKALARLNAILQKNPSDKKLAADCTQWINRLNDPLRVNLVFVKDAAGVPTAGNQDVLTSRLRGSGMYVPSQSPFTLNSQNAEASPDWQRYLDQSYKDGAKLVMLVSTSGGRNISNTPNDPGGVSATIFSVKSDVKVYGAKTKKEVGGFSLTNTAARIQKPDGQGEQKIYQGLMEANSDRVMFSLLKNDFF